jgi:hypothetical protein
MKQMTKGVWQSGSAFQPSTEYCNYVGHFFYKILNYAFSFKSFKAITASDARITKIWWWIGKDLEGYSCGLIEVLLRDWGKPLKTPVGIATVASKIQTEYLPNSTVQQPFILIMTECIS